MTPSPTKEEAARVMLEALEEAARYVGAAAFNSPNRKKKENYYGCERRLKAAIATARAAGITSKIGE